MESHVLPDNLMLEQIKIRLTEAGVAVTRRSSACVVKKRVSLRRLGSCGISAAKKSPGMAALLQTDLMTVVM